MAAVLWVLLAATGALAIAGIALAVRAARQQRAALHALADRRGWSHAPHPAGPFEAVAARVLPDDHGMHLRDALAGPSVAGPFTIARAAPRGTNAGASILHIRTPLASPGLHVQPAAGFRLSEQRDGLSGRLGHERFARIYDVQCQDEEFAQNALDWDACALLAAPARPVRFDWQGHDLVIAFPFAARTPSGIETFVAWGAQLAESLNASHGRRAARPPHSAPSPEPRTTRLPSGVDPLIP